MERERTNARLVCLRGRRSLSQGEKKKAKTCVQMKEKGKTAFRSPQDAKAGWPVAVELQRVSGIGECVDGPTGSRTDHTSFKRRDDKNDFVERFSFGGFLFLSGAFFFVFPDQRIQTTQAARIGCQRKKICDPNGASMMIESLPSS